eukprot:12679515-Alexandrium_andersonii.AAC.1
MVEVGERRNDSVNPRPPCALPCQRLGHLREKEDEHHARVSLDALHLWVINVELIPMLADENSGHRTW